MKKKFATDDLEAPHFHGWLSVLAFMTGLGAFATLIAQMGFVGKVTPELHWITLGLSCLFAFEQILALPEILKGRKQTQRNWWIFGTAIITVLVMVALELTDWLESVNPKITVLTHATVQTIILVTLILRGIRHQARLTAITLRPGWLLMCSFGFVVLAGTLLLKMPRAVVDGSYLSWVDALFTSTSAVCVTGLVVHNTADFFTPTGQVIILALIQFGGLGIMTITFFMAAVLFQGMSLHDRFLLGEMIAEKRLAHVGETLRFILAFTFITEALGAVAIYFTLPDGSMVSERIFQSVFHSISAFCNAGFSTFHNGLADDTLRDNMSLQLVITGITTAGGLGSLAVYDGLQYCKANVQRWFNPEIKRPRLRVHTRLVLITSVLLLVGGWPLIYFSEFVIYNGNSNGGGWMTALFKSASARTSGFNTVDMGGIGPLTIHFMVLLMFVGGSPGGTAGGIRTTVVATAGAYIWSLIRSTGQTVLFHRRLPGEIGPRSLAILVIATGWLFVNFAILRQVQPDTPDSRLFFELVSAFATVGLSLNLTPELTESAKWVIMVNMFIGRIGLFTFIITVMPLGRKSRIQHPQEDILLV